MTPKFTAGEPPKDGKDYLAWGNLGYVENECCHSVESFVAVIRWDGRLWLDRRGLSIAQAIDDTLYFHQHIAVDLIGEKLAARTEELFAEEMRMLR